MFSTSGGKKRFNIIPETCKNLSKPKKWKLITEGERERERRTQRERERYIYMYIIYI